VKEVERLKKNREERRLKQAELKECKEALMSQEPGNPNWDFINMIRSVFCFLIKKQFYSLRFSIRRDYQAGLDFRPLKYTDTVETHQITVCVRKRPLSKKGAF
jgi:kinesin family member 2/24